MQICVSKTYLRKRLNYNRSSNQNQTTTDSDTLESVLFTHNTTHKHMTHMLWDTYTDLCTMNLSKLNKWDTYAYLVYQKLDSGTPESVRITRYIKRSDTYTNLCIHRCQPTYNRFNSLYVIGIPRLNMRLYVIEIPRCISSGTTKSSGVATIAAQQQRI